jgi:hypothetical protein
MQETSPRKSASKAARIYGAGIVIFAVIVGFITLMAKFVANMNLS